mmetsp:Transcript_80653/g.147561  ORF Transcript_80653/g.147561 Transcript_80653/m.147561 type:complete len:294 (+) Transcript_80653:42-923(+)
MYAVYELPTAASPLVTLLPVMLVALGARFLAPSPGQQRRDPLKLQRQGKLALSELADILLVHILQNFTARELTIVSCTSSSMDRVASHSYLWKHLWRSRYGRILWSVPEVLREADRELPQDPLPSLRTCLETLREAPRWWVREPRTSHMDEFALFERRLGTHKKWKVFYFAFGKHWPKWAVAQHSHEEDCWLVIHGVVFDVTHFDHHPGRFQPFMRFAGLDATEAFEAMQHSWSERSNFGAEFIVQDLLLPKEGSIWKPSWKILQESVPMRKRVAFGILGLNVHRHLCYHDFW